MNIIFPPSTKSSSQSYNFRSVHVCHHFANAPFIAFFLQINFHVTWPSSLFSESLSLSRSSYTHTSSMSSTAIFIHRHFTCSHFPCSYHVRSNACNKILWPFQSRRSSSCSLLPCIQLPFHAANWKAEKSSALNHDRSYPVTSYIHRNYNITAPCYSSNLKYVQLLFYTLIRVPSLRYVEQLTFELLLLHDRFSSTCI